MDVSFTYLVGATYLIEFGGWRILSDPGFDANGTERSEGPGHDLKKVMEAPIGIETIGRIDVALISHQQHFDNLDNSGRALLPKAGRVLTHPESAEALGSVGQALGSWQSVELENAAGEGLKITATPAVHAPNDEVRKATGETTGFVLEWPGQDDGALLISGDTVWFDGIQEIGQRFDIHTGILHMGAANVPAAGDFRLTMDAEEGIRLSNELGLKNVFPAHFEGWMHYKQGREPLREAFVEAGMQEQLKLMHPGDRLTVEI
jgi:L-ascorbate metabolism protein UlaG (beta-lactamase superfamily)